MIKEKRKFNRLSEVLNERGLSGYGFCKKSGIPKRTIYYTLNQERQPSLPTLFRMAHALDINPCDLIGNGALIESDNPDTVKV